MTLVNDILFWAARREYYDIVGYLVEECRGDVNLADTDGNTFLHWASEKGRLEAVRFLVQHGSEVNAQNNTQETALHQSARHGHTKIVQYLVSAGCKPSVWNNQGQGSFVP